jgi:MFS family permease
MTQPFTRPEIKFLLGIGISLALRQFSLILIEPFLSIYGKQLSGHTPALIGLALGIYGLSQAVLQIPFGSWSDKWGRKVMVLAGVMLLALGLVLAGLVTNIYLFILARALQGSGAVMAVAFSWIGDRIPHQKRDMATSLVGVTVGAGAVMSFVGGPFLYRWFSMPHIFFLSAALTLIVWFNLLLFFKNDKPATKQVSSFRALAEAAQSKTLLKITISGFTINYTLIAVLFMAPLILEKSLGPGNFWKIFVPAICLGLIALRLAIYFTERGKFPNVVFVALGMILLSSIGLIWEGNYTTGSSIILVVISFILLTALLPSYVTKLSVKKKRGTVTGFFNTVQLLGAFLGGSITGTLWGIHSHLPVIIMILLSVISIWSIRTLDMREIDNRRKLR